MINWEDRCAILGCPEHKAIGWKVCKKHIPPRTKTLANTYVEELIDEQNQEGRAEP